MSKTRLYIVLVILLFYSSSFFGQLDLAGHTIINYTIDDGLPSNECHEVLQDSFGYIWIATDRGLVRYDGYEFKTYAIDDGLKDLVCIQLQIDVNQDIWINTESSIFYIYKREIDRIEEYKYNDHIQKYDSLFRVIEYFYIDSLRNGHFSIYGLGVLHINSDGYCDMERIIHPYYYYSIKDTQDHFIVYIGGRDSLNQRIEPKYSSIHYTNGTPFDSAYISYNGLHNLIPFNPNGSHQRGMIINRIAKGKYLAYNRGCNSVIDSQGCLMDIGGLPIVSVSTGQDSLIFVGRLYGGGLEVYNGYRDLLYNKGDKLMDNYSVTDVFIDKVQTVWIATLEGGLFKLAVNHAVKSNLIHDSLDVRMFASNGGLSFFSDGFECYISDINSTFTKSNFPRQEIHDLIPFKDGIIIAGSGSSRFYSKKGNHELYEIRGQESFPHPISKSSQINIDSDTLATLNSNNMVIHIGLDSLRYFDYRVSSGGKLMRINDVEFYRGQLMCAVDTGIVVLQDLRTFSIFKRLDSIKMRVSHLASSEKYLIFDRTGEGVRILDDDGLSKITVYEGLCSNNVSDIQYCSPYFVISSNKGLSLIDPRTVPFPIYTFTENDGLTSNSITHVFCKMDSVFISNGGDLHVLCLDNLSLSNRNVVFPLKGTGKNSGFFDAGDFGPNEKVEINYISLAPSSNRNAQYRYQLNNSTWTLTDHNTQNFDFLDDGGHAFRVQVRQFDSSWSKSAICQFYVKPHWYESTLFYLLVGVVILGISLYVQRSISVRRQNELLVNNELRTLERKALKAQMNPHFVFNCLNSIQNFIMNNNRVEAMDYLSKLSGLIRLNLKYSNEQAIDLDQEIEMIKVYLQLEKLRFKDRFDFSIETSVKDLHSVKIPSMLVQPFVENAIVHGMNDVNRNGKIEVTYDLQPKTLRVSIKDNGRGFDVNNSINPDSYGMRITRERLALLHPEGNVSCTVTSTPMKGTVVSLIIPFVDFDGPLGRLN